MNIGPPEGPREMPPKYLLTTGNEIIVIAQGPGSLSLLTWDPVSSSIHAHVGATPTYRQGYTHFLIGFSHYFQRFAFIWDGDGEAVYQIGEGLERRPVGRSWEQASAFHYRSSAVSTEDVSRHIAGAVRRDKETTVWAIPSNILRS